MSKICWVRGCRQAAKGPSNHYLCVEHRGATDEQRAKWRKDAGLPPLNGDTKKAASAAKGLSELRSRVKNGKLEIGDLVQATVLSMYFVQKLGQATLAQILAKIDEAAGSLNEHLLQQALEALRARGLASYASGRTEDGSSVKMWKPRRSIWAAPPEVAHITELLPTLVATPEAQDLIASFNEDESEGRGDKKEKRKLGYDDYFDCAATFETIDEMLGSQPASPWLDDICRRSKYNGVKADLRFWRDHDDGALVIGCDAMRGWLRTGLRTLGLGESAAAYIGVGPVKIYPKKPLKQTALPVIDQRTGRGTGVPTYETLQPGERFTVHFRLPSRGLMTPEEFELWLAGYGPNPIRGLSPARGGRFGKVALVAFEVLGVMSSATTLLEGVSGMIPEHLRERYKDLAKRARKVNLRKGSGRGSENAAN